MIKFDCPNCGAPVDMTFDQEEQGYGNQVRMLPVVDVARFSCTCDQGELSEREKDVFYKQCESSMMEGQD